MYHCMLDALQCFEGLIDDVRPGLGQYLYGHIVRNQVLVDQLTEKLIFRFGSSREADFDFLETDIYQQLEEIYLFLGKMKQLGFEKEELISLLKTDYKEGENQYDNESKPD